MKKNKRIGVMDLILVIVALMAVSFIVTMIALFINYGSIPDTLCTCFFVAIGGECGVMGWIKTTKERSRERKYELEDREHNEGRKTHERNID